MRFTLIQPQTYLYKRAFDGEILQSRMTVICNATECCNDDDVTHFHIHYNDRIILCVCVPSGVMSHPVVHSVCVCRADGDDDRL